MKSPVSRSSFTFSPLRKRTRTRFNHPFWLMLFLHCSRNALLECYPGGRLSTLLPSLWDLYGRVVRKLFMADAAVPVQLDNLTV